jgi:hypothetical protein
LSTGADKSLPKGISGLLRVIFDFYWFLVEKLSLISYNYYMSKKKKILKIYQDEYGKEPFIEK